MEAKDEIIHIALSNLRTLLAKEKQEGIKEAVEWVDNNIAFANIKLSYKEWQDQKERWGMKSEVYQEDMAYCVTCRENTRVEFENTGKPHMCKK